MPLLGAHLTLLIGPTVPLPAPLPLAEALKSVEVTHHDEGRSGFQLTFQAGRSGPADLADYALLLLPHLKPFNRVILLVTFSGLPSVLMDGLITHQQHTPSNEPGAATITVTGEDVSVAMDLEQQQRDWPAMPEPAIVLAILGKYAEYGLLPELVPPTSLDIPIPTKRVPQQVGTDLAYLREMAGRYSYVFYVEPGPAPGMNTAHWGPPKRIGIPQRALSVNLGPETNVDQIGFSYNALAPSRVSFTVQDSDFGQQLSFETFMSTRLPPLSLQPGILAQSKTRKVNLGVVQAESGRNQTGGLSMMQAITRAQSLTDTSTDNVVVGSGTLDALRYNGLLRPRGLVGVRGVGATYDGLYYVKSVTHSISKGEYKQRFQITRDGVVSSVPAVPA